MPHPPVWYNWYVSTAFQGARAITEAKDRTKKIMSDMKVPDVKIYQSTVEGRTNDTLVVVLFVQLNSKQLQLIVFSAGPSAKMFCDDFINRIKKVVRID